MGTLTVANTALVALIMYNFVQSYKTVKSRFTLGLLLFSSILLVQVVFSLPVIVLSGVAYPPEAMIFDIIAGSFELVALLIFLTMIMK
jgi:hypothetical protein